MNILSFKQFILSEGGNAHVLDKSGNLVAAEKIDLNKVSRKEIRDEFIQFFKELNKQFYKQTNVYIWKNENIITSGKVFNGSSEAFFDLSIPDEEFKKVKPKVGDIDITVPENLKHALWNFLNSIKGVNITQHIMFIGHNKPEFSDKNAQINSIVKYEKNGFKINVQIDFEFLGYDANGIPTEFAKFSHSSNWNDLSQGIKGVHHKYLVRALVGAASMIDNAQLISPKTNKPIKTPETLQMNKFSVDKGLRIGAYQPVVDETGKHVEINGKKAFKEIPASQSKYSTNVEEIAKHIFGDQITKEEIQSKMSSFLGLIDLMKKYLSQKTIEATLNRLADLYWGKGAQGFDRYDMEEDLRVKTTGWAIITKAFPFYKNPNLEQMIKTYYQNYKTTSFADND